MGLIERCFVWQAAYTPVLHTGESADPNLPSSTGESSSSDRKSAKKSTPSNGLRFCAATNSAILRVAFNYAILPVTQLQTIVAIYFAIGEQNPNAHPSVFTLFTKITNQSIGTLGSVNFLRDLQR